MFSRKGGKRRLLTNKHLDITLNKHFNAWSILLYGCETLARRRYEIEDDGDMAGVENDRNRMDRISNE